MTGKRARFALSLAVSAIMAINVLSMARAADIPDAGVAGWKGKKTCEVLHEDEKIRILRCAFPPNIGHERHFHPAAFTYVLSGGRLRITDARGTWQRESAHRHRLATDKYIAGTPVQWHEMLNIGNTTLRFLIVEKKY